MTTSRDENAVHVTVLFPASAQGQRSDHQEQAHLRSAAAWRRPWHRIALDKNANIARRPLIRYDRHLETQL